MEILRTTDLTKVFHQGEEEIYAVDHVNLTVEEGAFLVVTGRSGSGKTTLLNILACIDKADSGALRIDGEDVSNTAASYVTPWIEAVKAIKPQSVMIYTIDRDTPAPDLHKATPEELDAIRLRVTEAGFPCTVAY